MKAGGGGGKRIEAGDPNWLGARSDGEGTWFALYSAHAESVELCLFDGSGGGETARLALPENSHGVWHGFVPRLPAGTRYGYRVHGPYAPHEGHRFNPAKLLIDPYTRELAGEFRWEDAHFGYDRAHPELDLAPDPRDNAAFLPKSVASPAPGDPPPPRKPRIPWPETAIYECHVKGFTWLHPEVPESLRGGFAGMAQPAVIDYLKSLGITSVELMPVHAFVSERQIIDRGLSNYWGYNSLNFFCPHPGYLGGGGPAVFRDMVNRFHDAGLEVILDVVFNHSCEGDHLGPTLSFKGIDNSSYYQLLPGDRRFYVNDSGCGNTLNIGHPQVLRLILDSLRHWAGAMGVDGFRFDLAAILGRRERGFDRAAPFFQALAQDPLLAGVKLIAEPWDIGPGGYQLGAFPPPWAEWNDRYRDTIRRFWRGDPGQLPELARRLHGSGDLFEKAGRKPWASINHIACHDGFTLRDLVSYERRHNEANGEENRDGHHGNFSDNLGFEGGVEGDVEGRAEGGKESIEGAAAGAEIDTKRWRRQRNLLATLLLSQGTPMIAAGDEFGRSQRGNNNAWCQDNELSWIDWRSIGVEGERLREFTRKLLELRRRFPALRADQYRHRPAAAGGPGLQWLTEDGEPMTDEHWHEADRRRFGLLASAAGNDEEGADRHLLALFNASQEDAGFRLPPLPKGNWRLEIDTAAPGPNAEKTLFAQGGRINVPTQSIKILELSGTSTK